MTLPGWTSRDAAASRFDIERAHAELVAGNTAALARVRPVVRDSWERSRMHRVSAEGLPPLDFSGDDLERYRSGHPLAAALEVIRSLLLPGDPASAGVVVAVGDHAGRLLWVEGDREQRLLTGEMGFVAGANWSERAVGTSAPGVALALGESVQIHHAEHYNRLVQPWSCTAAPVFDPETGSILGVIDVTGGEEVATPQARLLVDATARAVESHLLVHRLRQRSEKPRRSTRTTRSTPLLRVLGDPPHLEVPGGGAVAISLRHAEILVVLATHPAGLSAERLAELIYGARDTGTLRPEMVRLRRMLARVAPALVPQSRPYRLGAPLETDAETVLSLLRRGAHRVALSTYRGALLPPSMAPGIEDARASLSAALREAMLSDAGLDALLTYADREEVQDDLEVQRLCLSLLPPRSPRRAPQVARVMRLEASLRDATETQPSRA